jgi:LysR family transcriptional regulator, benzoate and cis,cis-muconate-responsive activator of ben and cat genes
LYYDLDMTRISVRELECFVAVADHHNFSKAARQLNLSQPPLTRHVQALEEKLGTKVLLRNTHAVSLTKAGALFLEDARTLLRHLDRATDTIRRVRHGETARLRLAFIGALLDEKLVRLIQRFRRSHPVFQVEVSDLSPSAQLAAIQSGELDGGFIGAKPAKASKGLAFTGWYKEPLVLVLPEKHPLTRIGKLQWHHLQGLAWVLVSRQAAPAFRQQFSQIVENHAISIRIVQESDRVPAILTMVAAGSGVTVVPQSIEHLMAVGVVFRRLPFPEPILNYVFAYSSTNDSPALNHFLSLLRQSTRRTIP